MNKVYLGALTEKRTGDVFGFVGALKTRKQQGDCKKI
jgi:hypothetical protein